MSPLTSYGKGFSITLALMKLEAVGLVFPILFYSKCLPAASLSQVIFPSATWGRSEEQI
jgi:hypothetical protein